MKIDPIPDPLPGEHILATWPTIRPNTSDTRRISDPEWRQRLRFWSGRALTAQALERDQKNKAGRLAWLSRTLTPGIVQNLDVQLETPTTPENPLTPQGHFLHISSGYGITSSGEDVVIPKSLRIALSDIPIINADPEIPIFPQVGIIVLRPVELRRFDNQDPQDPCELDPSRDAFADEQRVDATQVLIFPIQDSLLNSFDLGDPTDPRWRNRLAHAFISRDAQQAKRLTTARLESNPERLRWEAYSQSTIPALWEQAGLPIALISSQTRADLGESRFFVDRYSIARRGAQAHPRSRPTTRIATEESIDSLNPPGSGNSLNWRTRIDQFASHLSELGPNTDIHTLSGNFQYIPPAGLLPRSALQILSTDEAQLLNQPDRAAVSKFFPDHLAIEALPVTFDDLDGILAASAPLAPIDFATNSPELIRLLVPVSQASFDPNLLVIEKEDPIFLREIGRLVAQRQDLLQRRSFIKARYELLHRYSYGPSTRAVDPKLAIDALEAEPLESDDSFPFASALRSPEKISAPAEISIPLPTAQSISDRDILFARVRTDTDVLHLDLEVTWQVGPNAFSHRWTEAPPYPQESLDQNGDPLATPLWRDFPIPAYDFEIKSGSVSSISLRINSGKIALSQLGTRVEQGTQEQIWWNEDSENSLPTFKGGEWSTVERASLVAPFESLYEPSFQDGSTLEERLNSLDTSLKLPEGKRVSDVGLSKVIADLEAEIKKGDDSVDLGFIKTQANIHRIRQVILGKEAANELLTSPALSSVIDSKSARLTTEELLAAYQKLPDKEVSENIPRTTRTSTDSSATPETQPSGSAANTPLSFSGTTFAAPELFNTSFLNLNEPSSTHRSQEFDTIPNRESMPKFPIAGKTGLFDESLFLSSVTIPNKDDVLGSEPKIGGSFIPRDLTFTKRFDDGATNNAYSYSKAELESTFTRLPELKLGIEDDDAVIPEVTDGEGKPITFGQISLADSSFLNKIKFPQSTTQDSSSVLSNGVKLADLNVLVLRRFEFHIARRRALLAKAKETLAGMQAQISLIANRLGVLAGKLAEARHDVSVARALRQEEQQRVNEINYRRDATIQEELKFLAYVRPRFLSTASYSLNGWKANSADYVPTVPACLAQHGEIPQGLKSYTELFTHSPARWFTHIKPQLLSLNRFEQLQSLLSVAQASAYQLTRETEPKILGRTLPAASQFAIKSGFSIVRQSRELTARTPFTPSITHGWDRLRKETEKRISLGDLISGKHGNTQLARRAAAELEDIEAVATCLQAEFSAVSPAIRLSWVERYSQFDQPSPLQNLSRLPHFQSFPRLTRQRFQNFADWLFSRIDQTDKEAVAMMNDLVRICLLLASHAPVKEIITGYVPRPTPIRPGIFIPILPFDLNRVRIGMQIQIWKRSSLVARGEVADLIDQEVSAKVESVASSEITSIDSSMRIQFLEPQFATKQIRTF